MSKLPPCHLTTKDFSFLELLRERCACYDEAYLHLLREKLSIATVVFQNDIEPQVATINSRVYFTVAGALADSRILVCGGDFHFPGVTLPITTMRGLALLGLKAGEAIAVRQSDGGIEEVRLDRVSHQPEAKRKERVNEPRLRTY